MQHTVEALRELELLRVGELLLGEHQDAVLVHTGTQLGQRVRVVESCKVNCLDLGSEQRMQRTEHDFHGRFVGFDGGLS